MAEVDHLVFAGPDLEDAVALIESRLGVSAKLGGQHPQFGTSNALVSLGDSVYLEIIGPDPDQPPPDGPRVFGIDELDKPKLVTWVARCDDIEEAASQSGIDLGKVTEGSRRRPDASILSWRLTDPFADRLGGVIPFLIDWGESHHPAADLPPSCELLGLMLKHPDADRVRDFLAATNLDIPVEKGNGPRIRARINTPVGVVDL